MGLVAWLVACQRSLPLLCAVTSQEVEFATAALATVVGVLVEVPVMLSVVSIVKKTRPWYEQRVPA